MSRGYRLNEWLTILPSGGVLVGDDTLVVADLHLGCEAALEQEGLSIPRIQTKKIMRQVEGMLAEAMPRRLVIAGDLKHNFSRNLTEEWQDVAAFVRGISSRTSVEVVRGNHDNYLGVILSEHGIPLDREVEAGRMQVVHGHRDVDAESGVIFGHIHPSLSLGEGSRGRIKTSCFLHSQEKDMLVLPALSLLSGGIDVMRQDVARSMSPVLSRVGLDSFSPIVFDGRKFLRFPKIGRMMEGEGV